VLLLGCLWSVMLRPSFGDGRVWMLPSTAASSWLMRFSSSVRTHFDDGHHLALAM
jgi:hypothetical protein